MRGGTHGQHSQDAATCAHIALDFPNCYERRALCARARAHRGHTTKETVASGIITFGPQSTQGEMCSTSRVLKCFEAKKGV